MTNEEMVAEYQTTHDMNIIYKLYEKNFPLIHKILQPYITNQNRDDLLQEGFLALVESAEKYDKTHGTLFMSYASYWLKRYAIRFLKDSNTIHIGSETMRLMSAYRTFEQDFIQEHGRSPTTPETAEHLGISTKQAKEIKAFSFNGTSLDSDIKGEADNPISLLDAIPDDSIHLEDDVIDSVYREEQKAIWTICKDHLSSRENEIITGRYRQGHTLDELAEREGVSRTRIQQIEHEAIRRLRMGKARKKLEERLEIIEHQTANHGLKAYKENNHTSYIEQRILLTESAYNRLKLEYLKSKRP